MEKEIVAWAIDPPEEIEENRKMIIEPRLKRLPFRCANLIGKRLVKAWEKSGEGQPAFAGCRGGVVVGDHAKSGSWGHPEAIASHSDYANKRPERKRLGFSEARHNMEKGFATPLQRMGKWGRLGCAKGLQTPSPYFGLRQLPLPPLLVQPPLQIKRGERQQRTYERKCNFLRRPFPIRPHMEECHAEQHEEHPMDHPRHPDRIGLAEDSFVVDREIEQHQEGNPFGKACQSQQEYREIAHRGNFCQRANGGQALPLPGKQLRPHRMAVDHAPRTHARSARAGRR